MDPLSGKAYDLEKDEIPDDVRERLIHINQETYLKEQDLAEAKLKEFESKNVIVDEAQEFDVQKEAETLGEILDEMDRVFDMPGPKPEEFYPINRAARRKNEKRNRALNKRKPNG